MKVGCALRLWCIFISSACAVHGIVIGKKYNGLSKYISDCGNSIYHLEICDRRSSGYYSHKDPSCYIKCDRRGEHRVRSCPRGEEWAGRYSKRYGYNRCEKVRKYERRSKYSTSRRAKANRERGSRPSYKPRSTHTTKAPAGPPRQLYDGGWPRRNKEQALRRKIERDNKYHYSGTSMYKDPNKPKNKDKYYEPVGAVSGRLKPMKKNKVVDAYEPIGPNIQGTFKEKPNAKELEKAIESYYYHNSVLGKLRQSRKYQPVDPVLLYRTKSLLPRKPSFLSAPSIGAREMTPSSSDRFPEYSSFSSSHRYDLGPAPLPEVPSSIKRSYVPLMPMPLPKQDDFYAIFPQHQPPMAAVHHRDSATSYPAYPGSYDGSTNPRDALDYQDNHIPQLTLQGRQDWRSGGVDITYVPRQK